MILRCSVKGAYPEVIDDVKWFWRNPDSKKLLDNFPSDMAIMAANDTSKDLVITKVAQKHRLVYVCQAKNSKGVGQEAVYLRVKSKLAALWPTIGIVAGKAGSIHVPYLQPQ